MFRSLETERDEAVIGGTAKCWVHAWVVHYGKVPQNNAMSLKMLGAFFKCIWNLQLDDSHCVPDIY